MTFPSEEQSKEASLLAIFNAVHRGAWETVGGLPLLIRSLYHVKKLNISKAIILVPDEGTRVERSRWSRWVGAVPIEHIVLNGSVAHTILAAYAEEQELLYLDASHLIDPRLLAALARDSGTICAFVDQAARADHVIRAARLSKEDLVPWAEGGDIALIRRSRSLLPHDLDPFDAEVRGSVPVYFRAINSPEEAQQATRFLIRTRQNQVMDVPAEFIDPPFENALTLMVCNTPITPNMVTFCGLGVAMAVTWLFWHGYFIAGALGTFLVEILDGVDGKLARIRLHYSKLGEHEDVIDYCYETSWYIALGVGLTALAPGRAPALLAALLVCSDTLDNILYTLSKRWHGKSIDLFSSFDASFRRIAGRRNIYGFMFIIGFLMGYPLYTFAVASFWAMITAGIHGVRLFLFGRSLKHVRGAWPSSIS